MVVRSDRGVQYSRNVQDVKKVPTYLEAENGQISNQDVEDGGGQLPTPEGLQEATTDDDTQATESIASQLGNQENHRDNIAIRPQRVIRKPNRFNDMILFSVFE